MTTTMDDIEDYETCAVHETAYLRASGCFDCKTSDASTAPMAGETPDTFEAGEPSRTEAQVSIDQARGVAAKFVAGDTRSGHHPDVVKTREAKHALHLLGYDGDTEAELFEDIKRTAILGNAVSRELLRQDEADKRAMIGERR